MKTRESVYPFNSKKERERAPAMENEALFSRDRVESGTLSSRKNKHGRTSKVKTSDGQKG